MDVHSELIDAEIIKKQFPYFEPELCAAISEKGQWVSLLADEALLSEDGYIRSFPLVLEGSIRISRKNKSGREVLLYYLSAGQVCSMALTCCMGNIKSTINAVADSDAEVLRIPIELLEMWMVEYRSWKEFVMYSYKHRFDELLNTIDSLAFQKMDERLIRFFFDIFRTTGKTVFVGKHQDIADALSTSREVVSRLLKQLEKNGQLELSRNRVEFKELVQNENKI